MNENDDPNPVYQRGRETLRVLGREVRRCEHVRRDSFMIAAADLVLALACMAFGSIMAAWLCAVSSLALLVVCWRAHRRLMRAADRYTWWHDAIANYRHRRDRWHRSEERRARWKLEHNLFERN
jgi:hypothetical protein